MSMMLLAVRNLFKAYGAINVLNDVSGMRHDGNDNRPFVWLWLLQAFELAIEQRRGHEVIGAGGDAPCHHVAIAF